MEKHVTNPPPVDPDAVARFCAVLAEPIRVRILQRLMRSGADRLAIELQFRLSKGIAQYHLRVLRAAGLITIEVYGKTPVYTLAPLAIIAGVERIYNLLEEPAPVEPFDPAAYKGGGL